MRAHLIAVSTSGGKCTGDGRTRLLQYAAPIGLRRRHPAPAELSCAPTQELALDFLVCIPLPASPSTLCYEIEGDGEDATLLQRCSCTVPGRAKPPTTQGSHFSTPSEYALRLPSGIQDGWHAQPLDSTGLQGQQPTAVAKEAILSTQRRAEGCKLRCAGVGTMVGPHESHWHPT